MENDDRDEAIVVVPHRDAGPPPNAALDATMGGGYRTLNFVLYLTTISNVPPPPHDDAKGASFPLCHRRRELMSVNPPTW